MGWVFDGCLLWDGPQCVQVYVHDGRLQFDPDAGVADGGVGPKERLRQLTKQQAKNAGPQISTGDTIPTAAQVQQPAKPRRGATGRGRE